MQTGIEKFKDVLDSDTCDLIVNLIESNLDQAKDLNHAENQNVIAKELFPIQQFSAELDQLIVKATQKCMEEYQKKIDNEAKLLRNYKGLTVINKKIEITFD